MTNQVAEFISTWWKAAVAIGMALVFIVALSGHVKAMIDAPANIQVLDSKWEARDSVTHGSIHQLARDHEMMLRRTDQRLSIFGFVLCDALNKPADECALGRFEDVR